MLSAALGLDDEVARALHFDAARHEHFQAWATRFRYRIGTSIDYVEGRAHHLWHGTFGNRRSTTRHRDLQRIGFDPDEDLIPDPSGAWRWSPRKLELRQFVADYFSARHEDDPPETSSCLPN